MKEKKNEVTEEERKRKERIKCLIYKLN